MLASSLEVLEHLDDEVGVLSTELSRHVTEQGFR